MAKRREPEHMDALPPAPQIAYPITIDFGGGDAPTETAPASPIAAPESPAPPPRGALTLYQHEDWLVALRDSEEGLTDEQQTERLAILDEIGVATEAAKRKRDNVARYLRDLDAIDERAGGEIKWLTEQRRKLQAHRDRVRAYVASVVSQYAPEPPPGKNGAPGARKLEGETFALALRKSPDSIEIDDVKLVPAKYKRVAIAMSCEDWYQMVRLAADAGFRPTGKLDETETADKRAVKAAIEAGEDVPGADLSFGDYSLEVRLRR